MPRLLTDEQVERIAARGAESVAELIWLERPGLDLGVDFVNAETAIVEALEHDLAVCLEGLMEPDEEGGANA